jgi:hypothetical protein
MADRTEEVALVNAIAGVASALAGAMFSVGPGDHNAVAHVPHQLLLAVPLGLFGTLVLRATAPRTFWIGAGAAAAGLVLGNVVLVAGLGLSHA